jgi:hypothetical protein
VDAANDTNKINTTASLNVASPDNTKANKAKKNDPKLQKTTEIAAPDSTQKEKKKKEKRRKMDDCGLTRGDSQGKWSRRNGRLLYKALSPRDIQG